jgi:hypothetical protein
MVPTVASSDNYYEEEIGRMILSWLILTLAIAMVFFYFQATCQRILRRQFDQEYFRSIANVVRLEFPSVRKSLEEFGAAVDYSRLPKMLKSDFLALTYLLKNSADVEPRYSNEERLLILNFRWRLLSLSVRHLVNAGEKRAVLRLTSVLQYFANLVGQRLYAAEFGNLKADFV